MVSNLSPGVFIEFLKLFFFSMYFRFNFSPPLIHDDTADANALLCMKRWKYNSVFVTCGTLDLLEKT